MHPSPRFPRVVFMKNSEEKESTFWFFYLFLYKERLIFCKRIICHHRFLVKSSRRSEKKNRATHASVSCRERACRAWWSVTGYNEPVSDVTGLWQGFPSGRALIAEAISENRR